MSIPNSADTGRPRKTFQRRQFGESAKPYRSARAYRRRGWAAPLPLPPRRKEHPPTGYTGRGARYPDAAQIDKWVGTRSTGNICLRMGQVTVDGTEYDTIGIDVDDYTDGDKTKQGGEQLAVLEAELGPLPKTVCSSARTDGRSGIRFFLARQGHLYRGKAAADIDIISPGYRYAVVYPSYHPDGGRYRWYPPGRRPDGRHPSAQIPRAETLPLLPDAWFAFLTRGGIVDEPVPIDADSTNDAIYDWARDVLPSANAEPCAQMRKRVDYWLGQIATDPSSHDKIKDAHWNVLRLAAEGHVGWRAAVAEVEKVWRDDVLARRKRSRSAVESEIRRSKLTALRKLKATVDQHARIGLAYIAPECACATGVVTAAQTYCPRRPRAPRTPRRYSA